MPASSKSKSNPKTPKNPKPEKSAPESARGSKAPPGLDDPAIPHAGAHHGIEAAFFRHLESSLGKDKYTATPYDKYLALAYSARDKLIARWIATQQAYYRQDARRVYYLSMEFLMGRSLGNALINLGLDSEAREAMYDLGMNLEDLRGQELEAGLGNGGLGRLAACFLDSMATLELPAYGYGIRYDYGMFHQRIVEGWQQELPDNWLRLPNPWEIPRPEYTVPVRFRGRVVTRRSAQGAVVNEWVDTETVLAAPYDTPVPGYGCGTVNTLRLWSAKSSDAFGLHYFNSGDYVEASKDIALAESISKVLYPNDSSMNGKELRLKQQYFLCAATLHDILRRHKKYHKDCSELAEKAAIQLNDTHPAISIPELMRLLVDEEGFSWEHAWDITTRVFAYTNHTLLPEALEKWGVDLLERLLPRHLQIIYEINYRFLKQVSWRYPGDGERLRRMSLIEEGPQRSVRMAYLAVVGSGAVNGVAALHTELLKSRVLKDFAELTPEKFHNKTNGVTPRRWLHKANPRLSSLITEKIGDAWIRDLSHLRGLERFADDGEFRERWRAVKRANKEALAGWIRFAHDAECDPSTLFDVQVKRIHEYKRQALNALHIAHLYNEIKAGRGEGMTPRTFIFGGKAAPGYHTAKLIIKMVNAVGSVVNHDPDTRGLLRVVFLEDYRVSLAEKIFPASDLSEQISTAGTEASGTGNMKFALNGALTLGTLDGANIEIRKAVGEENFFLFGLTAEEVQARKDMGYDPAAAVTAAPGLSAVLDLLRAGHFSPEDPGLFRGFLDGLYLHDEYMLFADFASYVERQREVSERYRDEEWWTRAAILNVARMGGFSSDRTIAEYNRDVWKTTPIPVPAEG